MDKFDYLGSLDINVLDKLYNEYLENPENVEQNWRSFFKGFDFAMTQYGNSKALPAEQIENGYDAEFKVLNLILAYRQRGHLFTKTNPVRQRRSYFPTLAIENFGLSNVDMEKEFKAGMSIGMGKAKLKNIVAHLEETYCKSVGVEFIYIRQPEIVEWLQKRMEASKNSSTFTAEDKKHFYFHINIAVGFEQFIHRKFVGQKRFSLEGAEALIPALDAMLEKGTDLGIQEFVIGMAHRGRLNVLANTLQKPYENIFKEFVGKEYDDGSELGDVKYHLGYCNEILTDNGKDVKVSLVPNPSHLETVSPIVLGIAKAKIYHNYQNDNSKLAAVLIHGDAAIASQGIVYEVLQMSNLEGYKVGGTIHLIINNQVGFTTNYIDARSSTYCTDIAKVTRCPVFHVNGDDVEAIVHTIKFAVEFRQTFHSDVFIDILCYRRYGHNEGDEPRFTQPLLSKIIEKHPNVKEIYGKSLVEEGIYKAEDLVQFEKDYNSILEEKLEKSRKIEKVRIEQFLSKEWEGYYEPDDNDFFDLHPTGVPKSKLIEIAAKINTLPNDKNFFSKIVKIIEDRKLMIENDRLDWALCELLAYATLVEEGFPVRVSGQDSERGTFSHRHAALVMEDSDEKYFPLKNVSENQASCHIYNSPLSEYGVLGFEYGYALALPGGLNIWEAQFGDFSNVAQVVFDQYISSANEKWNILNGLFLLLPHGFEGQGPEHSSARPERFLSLAVGNNIVVANCTTPANFFHLLRRQMKWKIRVPHIVFTPKSLLRHPKAVSCINELENGHFSALIDDNKVNQDDVKTLVFSSGKIYYDLLEKQESLQRKDIALIRIEQIHPFPVKETEGLKQKYTQAVRFLWVQEEPENMGVWPYILRLKISISFEIISRAASASPASGLLELHKIRQGKIIDKVFGFCTCEWKNSWCDMHCASNEKKDLDGNKSAKENKV